MKTNNKIGNKIQCSNCNEEFVNMTSFLNHLCKENNKVKWNSPKRRKIKKNKRDKWK